MNCVLIKDRDYRREERHSRGRLCEDRSREWSYVPQAKEQLQLPETGRGNEGVFPRAFSGSPIGILIWDFWPSQQQENKFVLVTQFVIICTAALGTWCNIYVKNSLPQMFLLLALTKGVLTLCPSPKLQARVLCMNWNESIFYLLPQKFSIPKVNLTNEDLNTLL